jgi:hypothetical protein
VRLVSTNLVLDSGSPEIRLLCQEVVASRVEGYSVAPSMKVRAAFASTLLAGMHSMHVALPLIRLNPRTPFRVHKKEAYGLAHSSRSAQIHITSDRRAELLQRVQDVGYNLLTEPA